MITSWFEDAEAMCGATLTGSELSGNKVLSEENLGDKIVALPTPVAVNDTYLVFAKSQNRGELLNQFNATLAKMKEHGSYDKLIADLGKSN